MKSHLLHRITTLILTAGAVVLSIGSVNKASFGDSPRVPNIVLILVDDLGYGEVGCYGQRLIQTPTLDRMAREGMRFTQFYAGACLCASSRNVLLTGEHTGHCRIRDNAHPKIQTLRPEDVTLAKILKPAGYATAIIGKWGIGGDVPETGGSPEQQGFDHFFGYLNGVHAHNSWPAYLWRNHDKVELGNVVQEVPPGYVGFVGGMATKKVQFSHDLIIEESLHWIRRQQHQPFFLLLTPTIPHANPEARKLTGDGNEVPDVGIYADKPWRTPNKGHAAMISRLDEGVGRILKLLKELHLDQNTLVIFTSDNGPHNEAGHDPDFFDANGPLGGSKFSLFEGGIRVPTIMRWPGQIRPDVVSDHVGYSGDFMATLCELVGAKPPQPAHGLDSISLLPTLLGRAQDQKQHPYLYWEVPGGNGSQAVRFRQWKAIRSPLGYGDIMLFDLANDLGEMHNVSDKYPEVAGEAERYLKEAHVESPHWPSRKPPENR